MKKSTSPLLPIVISMAVIACMLLAYTITRAALLSLTPDELSTIETFGAKFVVYPDTYHYMSANHHWLNSWLIFFSRSLFGDSEFAFRIPNLIAHAFYFFFTARLMLGLRKDYFALAGFILLNAHPYMLDFFSLARGYGLAFGGFAGGIYFLHRFLTGGKNKHIAFAMTSMSLAVLGNFGMLSAFLLFSGMFGFICLKNVKSEPRKTLKRLGIIVSFAGGLLLLIVPHLINLKKGNAFFWAHSSFWDGTVGSLCTGLLYDMPYAGKNLLRYSLPSIYVITGLLVIFSLYALIKKRWNDPGTLLTLTCVVIFFGVILSILIQSTYLDMPYPSSGRMVLFLFVLLIFAFVTMLASIQFSPKLITAFAFLLVVPVTFHMLSCGNIHYAFEWRGSGDVDRLMKRVVEDRKQSGNPNASVIVSADGEASCTIAWLHYHKWKLNWLENITCWTYDPMPKSDYYIVSKKFSPYRDKSKWKMIDTCTVSGNALYIDTASYYYRTGKSYQQQK